MKEPTLVSIELPDSCMSQGCHRRPLPLALCFRLKEGVEFWSPCAIHVETHAIMMLRKVATSEVVKDMK